MKTLDNLTKELSELGKPFRNIVLLNLLKSNKIDVAELIGMYAHTLKEINTKKEHSISSLGLMLGTYCMTDNSKMGVVARRHLYESGMYTENDGSIIGKQLSEEFKKEEKLSYE